jgi:hypothetical protein
LWSGGKSKEGIPLVKWDRIVAPKNLSGWVLKNIYLFSIKNIYLYSKVLGVKILWILVYNDGILDKVMKSKYIQKRDMIDWFRTTRKKTHKYSIVWRDLVQASPLVEKWLAWKVGKGRKVIIGEDRNFKIK